MPSKNAELGRQGPRKVVIVAYEGVKLMDVAGPLQAFRDARFGDGCPAYQVTLASEAGGLITSDTGVKLETHGLTGECSALSTRFWLPVAN